MSPAPSRLGARGALVIGLVACLAAAGCSFPDSASESAAVGTPVPTASAPPAGTTDPSTLAKYRPYYDQVVDWTGCDDDFQCAKVKVPMDWAHPDGQQVQLAVMKLPADGKRIGSLLVNPGGPGVPGITYVQAARQAFGQAVLRNYDVVGFDPRGIGASDPVHCLPNDELDAYTAADQTPDTPAELTSSVADLQRFAAACRSNSDDLLAHMDSISVARDMDVLRAALGESTLSFHGASYGTYLGAWYAQLFPWRVGRMVLDGAIDPDLTSAQYVAGQAEGFSRALRAYVADCQSQSECPLRGSVEDGLAQIGDIVDRADTTPLRTDDPSRPLTQSLMTTGIAQALYAAQLWPSLTIGLSQALSGNGAGLLQLADTYLERTSKGVYGQTIAANPAVFCLDKAEKRTPAEIGAAADDLQRQYPPLGGVIGWGALSCTKWPYPAVVPREKLTAPGAAPILVLGTVDDPATPYEWAQALASELSSGRLLTWQGTVHTAYHQGSTCIDSAVEKYLLTGTLPPDNTRCPA